MLDDNDNVLKLRKIWISDMHLGTPGSRATDLFHFLKYTRSETLYLVSDVIDGWQLKKRFYWPQERNEVIQKLLRKARHGTRVIYISGNHDEATRHFLGYKVGLTGLVEEERIELLERFFTKPLPSIVSKLFADAWGAPGSKKRLKKMADTISSNCKNFKRNDADKYEVAIEEWESDLGWLRKKFYKRGKFPWPNTFVD